MSPTLQLALHQRYTEQHAVHILQRAAQTENFADIFLISPAMPTLAYLRVSFLCVSAGLTVEFRTKEVFFSEAEVLAHPSQYIHDRRSVTPKASSQNGGELPVRPRRARTRDTRLSLRDATSATSVFVDACRLLYCSTEKDCNFSRNQTLDYRRRNAGWEND